MKVGAGRTCMHVPGAMDLHAICHAQEIALSSCWGKHGELAEGLGAARVLPRQTQSASLTQGGGGHCLPGIELLHLRTCPRSFCHGTVGRIRLGTIDPCTQPTLEMH